MKIKVIGFDNLTEDQKINVPDNGSGKEWANYIHIEWDDGTESLFSDAMQPEDASFSRDLSWVPEVIARLIIMLDKP
jgi:hypothetical protein